MCRYGRVALPRARSRSRFGWAGKNSLASPHPDDAYYGVLRSAKMAQFCNCATACTIIDIGQSFDEVFGVVDCESVLDSINALDSEST